MKHVSTEQLRDYQFKLLSENEMLETTAHLKTCDACREKLGGVKTQFQALDILQDQPEVSEAILAEVVAQRRRSFQLRLNGRHVFAIAATLLIAFGLFHFRSRTAGGPPAPSLAELRAQKPFAPASNIELNVLPRRDAVQLTIYNAEDLTLVRETRKLVLKRGWNWLQFMWSNTLIDPTSLSLEPQAHASEIEITQLVYPPRLKDLARWSIFSEISGEVEFELTYLTSGLKWNAFYEATLAPDEQSMQLVSYVRVDNGSGEDYENAQTRLVVGEINLIDKISVLASFHAYEKLTMLQIDFPSLRFEGAPQSIGLYGGLGAMDGDVHKKEILKKALSEYQLYTIEGRESIPDGWGKRLPSFEAQEIGVTNLYKFEAERWGADTMRFLSFANTPAHQLGETPLPKGRVRVFGHIVDGASSSVSMGEKYGSPQSAQGMDQRQSLIHNGAGSSVYVGASRINPSPVNETLVDGGDLSFFKNRFAARSVSTGEKYGSPQSAQGMDQRQSLIHNGAGSSVYVGASLIKYIPVGEEIELELGVARKVRVEPKLMRTRSENFEFDSKGNVSGWDEITDWKIELVNARDLPIEVEVMRGADSTYWNIQTDAPFEKYDATHFRFTTKLEPRSKKTLEYELIVHHGTRQE